MVFAFKNLTESALADELKQLKPVGNLVPCHDSVIALLVIKSVVYQPLQLARLIFVRCQVIDLLILANFSLLVAAQQVLD